MNGSELEGVEDEAGLQGVQRYRLSPIVRSLDLFFYI